MMKMKMIRKFAGVLTCIFALTAAFCFAACTDNNTTVPPVKDPPIEEPDKPAYEPLDPQNIDLSFDFYNPGMEFRKIPKKERYNCSIRKGSYEYYYLPGRSNGLDIVSAFLMEPLLPPRGIFISEKIESAYIYLEDAKTLKSEICDFIVLPSSLEYIFTSDMQFENLYYVGTPEELKAQPEINIGDFYYKNIFDYMDGKEWGGTVPDENHFYTADTQIYYYSATPKYDEVNKYWRYKNNMPTPW